MAQLNPAVAGGKRVCNHRNRPLATSWRQIEFAVVSMDFNSVARGRNVSIGSSGGGREE